MLTRISKNYEQSISINGVNCNTTVDEVLQTFPGLTEKIDDNGNLSILSAYNEKFVLIIYVSENTIVDISFGYRND